MSKNDNQVGSLRSQGKTGALNDMFNSNSYWRALYNGTTGALGDIKKAVLIAMGYTGSLSDMEGAYWLNGGANGLIDQLSYLSAVAAYSPSQKLRALYSGAAMRVRRSSDNLEADIGFVRQTNGKYVLDEGALMAHVGAENLLLWSEDFTNAAWSKTNTTISAGVDDPTGGTNASTLTAQSGVPKQLRQNATAGASAACTNSVWMRRRTGTGNVNLWSPDVATPNVIAGMPSVWTRYSVGNAASTSRSFLIELTASGDQIDIWGAQLNTSSTSLDYCKTTGTATTSGQNLQKFSGDFTNAIWNKSSTAVNATPVTGPDGAASAYSVTGSAADSFINQGSFPAVANKTYTSAVWLRVPTATLSVNLYQYVSAQTNSNTPVSCALTTTWQKFSITATPNAAGNLVLQVGGGSTFGAGTVIEMAFSQTNEGTTLLPYKATTSSILDSGSGYVTKVYDQTTNARDLAQATVASQPRIVFAGLIDRLNTRPAIRTDGVSQSMSSGSFVISQPFTRASVLSPLNASAGNGPNYISSRDGGTLTSLYSAVANRISMYAGTSVDLALGVSNGDKATIVESYNGASSTGSYNGASTAVSPGAQSIDGVGIGKHPASATQYGSALFGDIIIFPSAIGTTDRQTLEGALKTQYGTP